MTYWDAPPLTPPATPKSGGNRHNAETIAAKQADEAHITAISLFGELVSGDQAERALIEGIIAAASACGNQTIYQMAARLLRLQDREDPLHALGYSAVRTAWTNETAPGIASA